MKNSFRIGLIIIFLALVIIIVGDAGGLDFSNGFMFSLEGLDFIMFMVGLFILVILLRGDGIVITNQEVKYTSNFLLLKRIKLDQIKKVSSVLRGGRKHMVFHTSERQYIADISYIKVTEEELKKTIRKAKNNEL